MFNILKPKFASNAQPHIAEGPTRHWADKPILRKLFWFLVLPYQAAQTVNEVHRKRLQPRELRSSKMPAQKEPVPVPTPISDFSLTYQDELEVNRSLSFMELDNDSTVAEWLRKLATNGINNKERKSIVRDLRALIKDCAQQQRSGSIAACYKSAAEGKWLKVEESLPACYEDVRILVDGYPRIARLAYAKSYFQLATYSGTTKHQYVVSLDRVEGWQPLIAIPATTPQ